METQDIQQANQIEANNMITIDPADLSRPDAYRLMISTVVPRPIAWISTVSRDGVLNLAPFSFFNGVSGHPPIVMFSFSKPRSGRIKDTLTNVQETGELVINIVDDALAEAMVLTSGEWAADVDEFALAGLETAPSMDVRPPRVAAAPAAMEARLHQIVPIQDSEDTIVLARIVRYHVRAGLLRSNYLIDDALMRPVGRLGGPEYVRFGEVIAMERPQVPE